MMVHGIGMRRVVAVMDCLCEARGGASFTAIRQRLSPATAASVSRVLKTLIEEGWVEKNAAGAYRPADRFVTIARRVAGRQTLAERWRPAVRALAEATGESAVFAALQGRQVRFLVKHEMAGSFHYRPTPSPPLPAHNAFVRACLAWLPETRRRDLLAASPAEPSPATGEPARPPPEQVAGSGCFIEYQLGLRIAAPVRDGERLTGVIGITAIRREQTPAERDGLVAAVMTAAAEARASLNVRRPAPPNVFFRKPRPAGVNAPG